MSAKRTALLLDTNVLLDYFDGTRAGFEDAVALVLFAGEAGIPLYVTPTSLKDFYYVTMRMVKEAQRRENGLVSERAALSAEEFAWGCVECVTEFATVVSQGMVDVSMARSLRKIHRDFEDDLILAVALRCEASYFVTNDQRLAAKSPVPALSAADTLLMLRG